MSTLLATRVWSHSDMSATIDCRVYYDILSRSGSSLSVRVYSAVQITAGAGSDSRYGYDVETNQSVNGSGTGEMQIKPGQSYSGSTLYGGGSELSTYHDFSFDVGASSGSIPVSVAFYSNTDPNACDNGPTVTGNISYAATNRAPSAPTSVGPTSGRYISSISVSWSGASDPDGDTLTYDVQVSNDSGSNWYDIKTGATSSPFNYDISGHGEGTRYRFRVRSKDPSGVYSGYTSSGADVSKNYTPSAPTSVTPTGGIYNGSIGINWSGASDSDGETLHYELQVQINNGAWSVLVAASSNNTSTSYTYDISSHGEGTTYRFAVQAIDSLGATSAWAYNSGSASAVWKNRSPYATSSVWTDESFAQSSTTVRWNAASDPDSQSISYSIRVYKNGAYLETLTTSNTYYSYSFPAGTATNSVFTFGVTTVDSPYSYTSGETKGGSCIKKLPPTSPSILVPVNNGTVYDKSPRIAIQIKSDPNNDKQKLFITWGGTEYNSVDNSGWFSTTGNQFVDGNTIVIKPQVNGIIGSNSISIRTHNGYYYSASVTITLNIANLVATAIVAGVTNPKPNFITEIRTGINNLLQAYNNSAYAFAVNVSKDSPIGAQEITEMRNQLQSLISTLNGYDSNGTFDKSTSWSNPGIFINSAYIDELKTKLIDL